MSTPIRLRLAVWVLGMLIAAPLQAAVLPVTATYSYQLADNGLVPPIAVISGGALANLPVFATLTLTYTPEPGTLLLLGSGVAMLAVIGRRRIER